MMKKQLGVFVVFLVLFQSCIEEIDISTQLEADLNISSILVVEATITDELKTQEILLGRGRSFANDSLQIQVQNAVVSVSDNVGNTYDFVESVPGQYLSTQEFAAEIDRVYRLNIQVNGENYSSKEVSFNNTAQISNIYAERRLSESGQEGVAIYVDTDLGNETQPFLKYQYEETYKIIAPLWSPLDMVVLDRNPPYAFGLVPKEEEKRVCYGTNLSTQIIQNKGIALAGNSIDRVLIRFISKEDYKLTHRYSILVKQQAQTSDAFAFYETLNALSSSSSIFTDVQPGFIEGNISNVENSEEKVIGYFEVVNQSESRLFFNYEDFFPEEELPDYPVRCSFLGAPVELGEDGVSSPLLDAIDSGDFVYVRNNDGQVEGGGPYLTARRPCGDCTALGSNVVPDFWIEE